MEENGGTKKTKGDEQQIAKGTTVPVPSIAHVHVHIHVGNSK